MDYRIVRHTPFHAVYLYIDAAKALKKVRALHQSHAHFVILDARSELPVTLSELERAASGRGPTP